MNVYRLSLLFLLLYVVVLSTSCNHNRNDDAVKEADSINASKYKAMPTQINIEKNDAGFIVLAASISTDEISLGALAQKKGQDRRIKNLGSIMVIDHNKLQAEIKELAKAKNVTLAKRLGSNERKLIGVLSRRNGKDFDKAYLKSMNADHQDDVKLFEKILKKSFDPEIKALANKNLSMLHAHLDAINTLYGSIK